MEKSSFKEGDMVKVVAFLGRRNLLSHRYFLGRQGKVIKIVFEPSQVYVVQMDDGVSAAFFNLELELVPPAG